jgi:hypothetical protein
MLFEPWIARAKELRLSTPTQRAGAWSEYRIAARILPISSRAEASISVREGELKITQDNHLNGYIMSINN